MIEMSFRGFMHAAGVTREVEDANFANMKRAALIIQREAQRSMKGGGREHVPSPPGTPPNVQTGNLRAAITIAIRSKRSILIGPTREAFYGRYHEQMKTPLAQKTSTVFGGRRFPQRAFMRPALLKVIRERKELFRRFRFRARGGGRL